ncbi:MAG: type II toxin-antitoxin system CcdA family antitoxin [Pseudonocardia sp.]|nr:type II toxin-antitoxin system CcdA family antitoxin [Pseudonocardia sp.]
MARVNITIPDELLARARAHDLNVSAAAAAGLEDALVRIHKNVALDRWLAEMEAEHGPSTPEEIAKADARIDRAFVVGGTHADTA